MMTKNASSAVALTLAAAFFALFGTNPATAAEKKEAVPVPLVAGPQGPVTFIRPATPAVAQPEAATFVVTYTGFPAAAKTAFQRAVNIWKGLVTSSVPITISAQFTPLGTGILGSAGPNFVWRDFSGAPVAGTWYVDALANKLHASQLDASPDIVARFSSNFPNWHYGSGPAPAGKYDFTSVVLHEIGHGLGFLGAGFVSGGKGTVRISGLPIVYDRYTENNAGKALLTFADNSAALAAQLQGGNLYFDSAQVRAANGNLRARLYAPAVFQPGSTYSHLNEATYPAGNAHSLMTPQLGQGETIRSPGAITLAIFRTLGW